MIEVCPLKNVVIFVEVDESNNNGLYQKILLWTNWGILGSKMAHPHNSGPTVRIFKNFVQ